jgi:hypothetical protein
MGVLLTYKIDHLVYRSIGKPLVIKIKICGHEIDIQLPKIVL